MSEHFTLAEMCFSSTGERLGIDNTPPPAVASHLVVTMDALERIRTLLGDMPLHIDSGYRNSAVNRAVGSEPTSGHILGWCVDFKHPTLAPIDVIRLIYKSNIRYDQIIQEGSWTHFSVDPKQRMEILTAHFPPGGGKPTYTVGL